MLRSHRTNRLLSRCWRQTDQYLDPLQDLGLSLDPLTNHRTMYAAGNPINMVDEDGHIAMHVGGGGGGGLGGSTAGGGSSGMTLSPLAHTVFGAIVDTVTSFIPVPGVSQIGMARTGRNVGRGAKAARTQRAADATADRWQQQKELLEHGRKHGWTRNKVRSLSQSTLNMELKRLADKGSHGSAARDRFNEVWRHLSNKQKSAYDGPKMGKRQQKGRGKGK